jgi:DNA-binding NarL/FixJ family response regulator
MTERPSPITCVLADDHPAVLDAVARYLEGGGVSVVARARDGADALAKVESHRPNVAVVDVQMARIGGLELTRQITRRFPETAVVIYSGFGRRDHLLEALDAGARGFVVKDAALSELVRAIEIAVDGGTYIDAALGGLLARQDGDKESPKITPRERDVLRLLSKGMSNEEIGREIFISGETVRNHPRSARGKLGAKTRTEAVATALRLDLIA